MKRRIIFTALTTILITDPCHSFLLSPSCTSCGRLAPMNGLSRSRRRLSLSATIPDRSSGSSGSNNDEIETLIKSTKKQELVDLCTRMGITNTKGTKEELLKRLQDHAAAQIQANEARKRERIRRIEEGSDNPKERYEIVTSSLMGAEDDEDDEEDYIFYHAPEAFPDDADEKKDSKPKKTSYLSQASVTAPPPPEEPNEDGERVVKVYSTTEQNDLTGIAASQPGQTAMSSDALTNSVSAGSEQSQPWDAKNNQRSTSSKEEQKAKEEIIELVQTLLSTTGLPAFYFGDDDNDEMTTLSPQSYTTGFDPTKISNDLLAASSQALRTGRGAILEEVLRQFEYQAIGQDGMHGDKTSAGGGHYREVAKVRAFLEGYRRAEVRRIARETTSLLLDKLVLEGIQGLDMTLRTMTRSGDDTSSEGGCELNDSLLDYLNDAIRQQEKKVDALVAARLDEKNEVSPKLGPATTFPKDDSDNDDLLNSLWNVTTTEDGQRLESLDPKDPKVKAALKDELVKQEIAETLAWENKKTALSSTPTSAPEQLLLLLTLLRERIKAEAVFAPDEKGRNLRLLAYCLQLSADTERRQLISKELGNSLDRVDSFIELVSSSVEYGESTSYQLQPAKTKKPLDVRGLRRVLSLAQDFRTEQEQRASGVR